MEKFKKFHIKYADWIGRVAIFLVYFWFGLLKLLGNSPAESLVTDLQQIVLPFIPSDIFMILLGLGEMAIGVMFLIPGLTLITTIIFYLHMLTTFLPMIFLPGTTWNGVISLTLEGQYIIKNFVLIGLVFNIARNYFQKDSNNPVVEQHEQAPQ